MSKDGLQIDRYTVDSTGYMFSEDGPFCKFSDAEKYHTMFQEEVGKRLKLSAEVAGLREAIENIKREIGDESKRPNGDRLTKMFYLWHDYLKATLNPKITEKEKAEVLDQENSLEVEEMMREGLDK